MTTRLYTTYKQSKTFKETPIFDDWSIKRDWNKASSLNFKSSEKLDSGTHVKLLSDNHMPFGGQIVKKTEKSNEFYSYECLDYKRYLLRTISSNYTNLRSSDIVKSILKKYISSNVPIKAKVSNTKNIFSSLIFQDKTILEIISTLINLEYQKGNLVYFDVDYNANLIYKLYPQKIKGYTLDRAITFSNSIDHQNIQTGYQLLDSDYNVIKEYFNSNLENIWGKISNVKTMSNDSNNSNNDFNNQTKDKPSDSDIKKIVKEVNNSLRSYKHTKNGGSCDCICMSEKIFNKLKNNQVPCKWVKYHSSSASNGYHHSVLVKYKSQFVDFDYKGMDYWYGAISSKSKNGSIQKEYKG